MLNDYILTINRNIVLLLLMALKICHIFSILERTDISDVIVAQVCYHVGSKTDPDQRDMQKDRSDIDILQRYIARCLPGLVPEPAVVESCLYTVQCEHHAHLHRAHLHPSNSREKMNLPCFIIHKARRALQTQKSIFILFIHFCCVTTVVTSNLN